ncbi:DUF3846 domain-containing protein [Gordonia alkanivorans]|uniref:DUF3846 domain-containing protein n=1 Tax=Gordonia alkanivorans TaxID=84096 RepID=UPI0004AF6D17|nr:DUF3846 domain-containing protein [Gordonia alkanivorans]
MTTTTRTVNALRISPFGGVDEVTLHTENDSMLAALYRSIECRTVECMTTRSTGDIDTHVDVWLDEEGRINGSSPNFLASAVIASQMGRLPVVNPHTVTEMVGRDPGMLHYGVALFAGFDARTGDIADIPEDVVDHARSVVADLLHDA